MNPDPSDRRKEPRYPVEAGASVEVHGNGRITHATTIDMSGAGALLRFDEPVQLTVGDQVICEFAVSHDADRPLPYWGVGDVVRVDGCRAAISLRAAGLSPIESGSEAA